MNKIKLKWLDLNRTGQGYKVYRSDNEMDIENLPEAHAIIPVGTSEFEDDGIEYGSEIHYIISAVDEEGSETYSKPQKILCKESVYGVTGDGVTVKMTYDFQESWQNFTLPNGRVAVIDSDIFGNVAAATTRGAAIIVDTLGLTRFYEQGSSSSSSNDLNHATALFTVNNTVYLHKSASSGYQSTARIFKVRIGDDGQYDSEISRINLYSSKIYDLYGINDGLISTNGSNLTIQSGTPNYQIIWQNSTVSGTVTDMAADSVGYIYAAYSTGKIVKIFPDLDAYVVDPTSESQNASAVIWEDTTTFPSRRIRKVQTDRVGAVIVASDDGKVAKFNTSEELLWEVELATNVTDMRVEYTGKVLVSTEDNRIIRLDGNDGSTITDHTLPYRLNAISIDPGRAHIMKGSIIKFGNE